MTKNYLNKPAKNVFWQFWLLVPYVLWMYSIVIELNKKTSNRRKLINGLLIGLLTYPALYILVGLALVISGKADMDLLMPFHVVAMICVFFLIALASITIVRFERTENLKQSNGLGLFFGIWFFIFGVWHIQPKLNEYIKRIK